LALKERHVDMEKTGLEKLKKLGVSVRVTGKADKLSESKECQERANEIKKNTNGRLDSVELCVTGRG